MTPELHAQIDATPKDQFESSDEPVPMDDGSTLEEDESVPQEETFTVTIAVPHYQRIPAIDAENREIVDRESSQADFWLKSNDPNSSGASYSVEGLNGAVLHPILQGNRQPQFPRKGLAWLAWM